MFCSICSPSKSPLRQEIEHRLEPLHPVADMAARSLGNHHPAYAVALHNLGTYYDVIEQDGSKANDCFAPARGAQRERSSAPLQLLLARHLSPSVQHDPRRAAPLARARNPAPGKDDLQLADTMIALARAKAATSDIDSAIELMEEALKIQRAKLPPTDPAIRDSEKRLAVFQAMASADPGQ